MGGGQFNRGGGPLMGFVRNFKLFPGLSPDPDPCFRDPIPESRLKVGERSEGESVEGVVETLSRWREEKG